MSTSSEPPGALASRGLRLACRRREGRGPTLIFLPGYMSDMNGSKAAALDAWAAAQGRAMLRFDYAGCGASEGAFEEQSLAGWRDDALAAIDSLDGRVILVGSSMGGWLMLLAALARPERVAALVGIAAAPDFTDWGFDAEQKRIILEDDRIEEASPYGEAPYVTTRLFWESGERLKLIGDRIAIRCPIRLLHGLADEDVPWQISLELLDGIESGDARLTLVKGGDHRLSGPGEIELLLETVEALVLEGERSSGVQARDLKP
ncbi:MAG TPA: alpha/beta hydrolase [Allosphingosinicella sp.]|nr:alpha/beta hydrolase [Allosphingosinicella sp.]